MSQQEPHNVVVLTPSCEQDVRLSIGSTAAGLCFLSDQAEKDGLPQLKEILDQAIFQTIVLGSEICEEDENEHFINEVKDTCTFVDLYCSITDPVKKKNLAELVNKLSTIKS